MYNIIFITCSVLCAHITSQNNSAMYTKSQQNISKWTENEEIQIFREYLRIPTVQPNPDYQPAIEFLRRQAASLDLPVSIFYPVNDKNPVLVMAWKGSQPELPSIMLNSHMDVVPVVEEYWTHPPFAAEIDENGDIFARGTQDTKCVGTQYLAAIRSLKRQGINQLKRTIYITFVPDEETGGALGMAGFVKLDAFKEMNVTFVLDEGDAAKENDALPVFYNERANRQTLLEFNGISGHGSKLFGDTAGEKFNYVLGKLSEYRAEEKRKLDELKYPLGNVTTINLTMLKGGVANNVIPAELSAIFDIRASVNMDIEEFEKQIDKWCQEAGGNITRKVLVHGEKQKATRVDDSNPFWVAFKNATDEVGLKIKPTVAGGSTDLKYIRNYSDISAIGFAPMINTTSRAHNHNEYLNADVYLYGIEVYKKVITGLANV